MLIVTDHILKIFKMRIVYNNSGPNKGKKSELPYPLFNPKMYTFVFTQKFVF